MMTMHGLITVSGYSEGIAAEKLILPQGIWLWLNLQNCVYKICEVCCFTFSLCSFFECRSRRDLEREDSWERTTYNITINKSQWNT